MIKGHDGPKPEERKAAMSNYQWDDFWSCYANPWAVPRTGFGHVAMGGAGVRSNWNTPPLDRSSYGAAAVMPYGGFPVAPQESAWALTKATVRCVVKGLKWCMGSQEVRRWKSANKRAHGELGVGGTVVLGAFILIGALPGMSVWLQSGSIVAAVFEALMGIGVCYAAMMLPLTALSRLMGKRKIGAEVR